MGKRSAAAFKLKPTIAFAGHATVGAVLALAGAGSVFAQGASPAQPAASAPETPVVKAGAGEQQVVVTGIRRGIEAAISVKKNSDQIVEAISAEDIGKLPDTTVAESLAHLPGVTAQRDRNGLATNVNIRGLGSDFNGYLLNGREQTSTGDSRAVDLSVYPAELLSGATVYKTGDASLVSAGLAGTIDNKLIDPLAFPERVIAISGQKGHPSIGLKPHGDNNRESITYIDQFADRKIGLAIGFVRADGSSTQLGVSSWASTNINAHAVGDDSAVTPGTNLPFGGGMGFDTQKYTDKRTGLAAILEIKPTDNFKSELDIYHAQINSATHHATLKAPLPGDVYDATVDPATHQITSGTYRLGANPSGLIDYTENISDDDSLQSLGWRSELKLNDTWRASLDVNQNKARRIERDIEAYAGIKTADNVSFTLPVGGVVPHITTGSTDYTAPGAIVIRDQSGWSGISGVPQDGYDKGPTTVDKISAVRMDFTHDLAGNAWFSDLQFGVNWSERSKNRTAVEALVVADTPDGTGTIPFPAGSYVVSNVGGTGLDMLSFNPTANLWPGARLQNKFNNDILSKSWNVTENVTTGYGKFDIDSQVGQIPVRGNVGMQVVFTNQHSQGFRANAGPDVTLTNPAAGLSTAGTRYTDYLPSLNLVGDLGNGNTLRFGAGIQIARPDMTDLRNSYSVGGDNTNKIETSSSGNPFLKPFKAKALDLSYEKYFANKAYLAGAVFFKKLDTYITRQTQIVDLQSAAAAVGQTSIPGDYPNGWVGPYTQAVNGHGGNLKGFELSASLPFNLLTRWADGFGTALSYSNTTSSIRQPNVIGLNPTQTVPGTGGTIGLPGLSHINEKVELYFEKWGFSAFVSDTYRSKYIGPVANTTVGGYPTLINIASQQWISAQMGYEFQTGWLKGLGVRLEGNNLNKPLYKEYKADGTLNSQNFTGASIDLRVSYKL